MRSWTIANALAVFAGLQRCVLVCFRLWAATIVIALALLTPVDPTLATTIEQFSVRHIDRAVEVDFGVRGTAPRWHLHNHAQELWLDLKHSLVAASVEGASVPVFPLTGVSMRDFGDGRVRLIIRVRGQVDYVVAQMPHEIVVRIAPSGEAVDLAHPLWAEMEKSRALAVSPAPGANKEESSRPVTSQALTAYGPYPVSSDGSRVTNLSIGAKSALASPDAPSINPFAHPPLVSPATPSYGQQAATRSVRPVNQELTQAPWLAQDRSRPVVVIDAGHGGFDPGAEAGGGLAEKSIALAIARRLAASLATRGVDGELTRNDDKFLSLQERTGVANHAHADLFVSIHLNSSPDWNTSGIETYYLNNTTDRATIRLARLENGGGYSTPSHSNLNYILTNLRQDYKAHESSSLARMIEAEAAASVDRTLGIRVNALGPKMGPFYVLVGAEMPSVLIECGFLSNPREVQYLLQPGYQQALADGITLAILHYFQADAAVGNL
jgi:N-acetylmuramoyl-L-alanine amidase